MSLHAGVSQTDSPFNYGNTGPSFTPAQKANQSEAAATLIANLKAALSTGKKELLIAPGDYRFDQVSIPSFNLKGVDGFHIIATGATFWCDGSHRINLENCRNVTIEGLTIDSDPLPWVQGVVTAIDVAHETLDFHVDEGYPLPTGGASIEYFNKDTGNELNAFDEGIQGVQPLGDRLFRVTRFNTARIFRDRVFPRPLAVGDKIVLCTPRNGGNIFQTNCSNNLLKGVTVYAAGGFVYIEHEGAGGNIYLNCKLVRRPHTNRLIAAPRDGFHSSLMEKGPLIQNCEFSFAGDDLIAIHGHYGVVAQDADADEIRVATILAPNLSKGAKIQLLNPETGEVKQEAVVVDVALVQPGADETIAAMAQKFAGKWLHVRRIEPEVLMRVRLDHKVKVSALDLIASDEFCGSGAVISNCYLHDGHVRAITAKSLNLTVEDNLIERMADGGVVLEPEFYWLEGPAVIGAKITGNYILECGWSAFDRVGMTMPQAAIHIGSWFGGTRLFPRRLLANSQPNQHIYIENNKIERSAGAAISVANTQDVVIKNNIIVQPFSAGDDSKYYRFLSLFTPEISLTDEEKTALNAPYYAIFVRAAQRVTLEGNRVSETPPFYAGDSWVGTH